MAKIKKKEDRYKSLDKVIYEIKSAYTLKSTLYTIRNQFINILNDDKVKSIVVENYCDECHTKNSVDKVKFNYEKNKINVISKTIHCRYDDSYRKSTNSFVKYDESGVLPLELGTTYNIFKSDDSLGSELVMDDNLKISLTPYYIEEEQFPKDVDTGNYKIKIKYNILYNKEKDTYKIKYYFDHYYHSGKKFRSCITTFVF